MAGLAAALSQPQDEPACRQFCAEALASAQRWGPAEQRALLDQLPVAVQRLYVWLSMSKSAGLSEALLRTFHPAGPLISHLASHGSPAFVFPLRKLPPRTLRAAVLSTSGAGGHSMSAAGLQAYFNSKSNSFGSGLFGLLGRGRVVLTPSGDIDGIALTAQEYVLACLVHYLGEQGPGDAWNGVGGGFGVRSAMGASALGGAGSGMLGAVAGGAMASTMAGGLGGAMAMPVPGVPAAWGSRGMMRVPGLISATYERLLLAFLRAHLRHSEYEVAYAHEPQEARLLLHMLHEFLLAPQPPGEAVPASLRGEGAARLDASRATHDFRAQPAALHGVRLLALHVLANPALRLGCEEALGPGVAAGYGVRAARLTREVALLGPPLIRFIAELLTCMTVQRQAGVDAVTSLTRLWLILLQPWKAPRLYAWYMTVRDPEPKLEPPQGTAGGVHLPAAMGRGLQHDRNVDIALLGLEPEMPPEGQEPPPPQLPQGTEMAVDPQGAGGLAGMVGLAPVAAIPLLPGAGDAQSWRSYVANFQEAYNLVVPFLTTPIHQWLSLQLCCYCAGLSGDAWRKALAGIVVPEAADFVGAAAGAEAGGEGAAAAPPAYAGAGVSAMVPTLGLSAAEGRVYTAPELLRQRHIIGALKALAQALLCFSDPQLLRVLSELPEQHSPAAEFSTGGSVPGASTPPPPPLFVEGLLHPELISAVSLAWAGMLAAASVFELQPLIASVSRQLQHNATMWADGALPALEDTERHRHFALQVYAEFVTSRPSVSGAGAQEHAASAGQAAGGFGSPVEQAEFRGSEWQRPVRGSEVEVLLQAAYWLALMMDRLLGREPWVASCGLVPQTEWPRMFANWKLCAAVAVSLFISVSW